MNHVGDDAELYALGALSESERAAVDAHALQCDECAARLGEAEATVAATVARMDVTSTLDARVRHSLRRRAQWFAVAAVAAAFVGGLFLSTAVWRAESPAGASRAPIAAALVNSHFAHVPFTPLTPDAPKAKMLYGRSASGWIYVVAQTQTPYVLKAVGRQGSREIGALQVDAGTADLFVASSAAQNYALFEGTREVARVTLPYRR